jgi:hypothetical protein
VLPSCVRVARLVTSLSDDGSLLDATDVDGPVLYSFLLGLWDMLAPRAVGISVGLLAMGGLMIRDVFVCASLVGETNLD